MDGALCARPTELLALTRRTGVVRDAVRILEAALSGVLDGLAVDRARVTDSRGAIVLELRVCDKYGTFPDRSFEFKRAARSGARLCTGVVLLEPADETTAGRGNQFDSVTVCPSDLDMSRCPPPIRREAVADLPERTQRHGSS